MDEPDGGRRTSNAVHGHPLGNVVQAHTVQNVHFHDSARRVPVPLQLPPPPRAFTGRERELDLLRRWREETDSGPLLAVVTGPGGVGKSSLAVHWLASCRAHHSHGELYADLGAFRESGPVDPEQVLGWFLTALGVPEEDLPGGQAPRQALYRSLTARRSLAILLDDAASAAQVRPLLPASAASVVVTSRFRLPALGLDGARLLDVGPMDGDASLRLLSAAVGGARVRAEPVAAEELIRLCGGLPIALSVVGARLSARPRRPIAREVGGLRIEDGRLSALAVSGSPSVERVFDVSYEELSQAQARVYRWCALHPGTTFDVAVAAAAVERRSGEVEPVLWELVEKNLLTAVDDDTFRYHDLLRLHARQQAERFDAPADRDATRRRLLALLLDRAVAADLAVAPEKPRFGPRYEVIAAAGAALGSRAEGLRWWESERTAVTAAIHVAARHGWDDLVWQLCDTLWGFFLHRHHHDDLLSALALGVPAAHRDRAPVAEGRLRLRRAHVCAQLGRYEEVLEENAVVRDIAEAVGDVALAASTVSQLGRAARARGDLQGALRHYRESTDLHERAGVPRGTALSRRRIGETLVELGRLAEAEEEFRAAIAVMAELGDVVQHARTLVRLGLAQARGGDAGAADVTLLDALDVLGDLDSPHHRCQVLTARGEVAELSGDLTAASEHYTGAHVLAARTSGSAAADLLSRIERVRGG
ncbi:NB-ARC domain-containing protein [Umezawaea beigongshangensis]|uniref:NB-ARC domain-containing protein n=1 Tax=Umezawaea beigongshangensis TaxID=2780383 RepID=UPI0018F19735|nr:AAA family ATPase [Umezawaea beigongshangensis]